MNMASIGRNQIMYGSALAVTGLSAFSFWRDGCLNNGEHDAAMGGGDVAAESMCIFWMTRKFRQEMFSYLKPIIHSDAEGECFIVGNQI